MGRAAREGGELVDLLFWVPVVLIPMIAVGGVLAAFYFGEVRRKESR